MNGQVRLRDDSRVKGHKSEFFETRKTRKLEIILFISTCQASSELNGWAVTYNFQCKICNSSQPHPYFLNIFTLPDIA